MPPAFTIPYKQAEEDAQIKQAMADPQSFKVLYQVYFKKVFRFILFRVNDKELAADLTQHVFLKALSNLSGYEFRGYAFSAWLYKISINVCNEYYRKIKREQTILLDEQLAEKLVEEFTDVNNILDWEIRLPEILEQLTEDELTLIVMRFFEERPFKEIAEIVGITENNAKVKTYRILNKMRSMFDTLK
ncbi:MAG: sigma-70 family RNA polymerase sigma factor [Cyclobacteriaceae bacterium]|jgi:RNA polymerase sigma-70 factor (ECF subfamily)|nr:sigma-70 family RNA polymerase sigma factor [Cytophagales bacterium]MCZ8326968.1 sigma-70 family RNA polymerase sigma factor [Cyclobacteriaceae bacterium]